MKTFVGLFIQLYEGMGDIQGKEKLWHWKEEIEPKGGQRKSLS